VFTRERTGLSDLAMSPARVAGQSIVGTAGVFRLKRGGRGGPFRTNDVSPSASLHEIRRVDFLLTPRRHPPRVIGRPLHGRHGAKASAPKDIVSAIESAI
jgi:hypothetical protein